MTAVGRRVLFTCVGGVLVLLGLTLMPLPGPGLLVVLVGVIVLTKEYHWASRLYTPVRDRAMDAAQTSVATPWRLGFSLAAAMLPLVAGVVWMTVPSLPFSGVGTGSSLILSGLAAIGLVLYSLRRRRTGADESRSPSPSPTADRARQGQ